MSPKRDKSFEFKIIKHYAVISEGTRGWRRELNSVSWNGAEPKFDIRDWSADHEHMGKGVSMTENEMICLKDILDSVFSDSVDVDFPDESLFEELGKE